jgi:type IV secretory pathway VirB10-like protein
MSGKIDREQKDIAQTLRVRGPAAPVARVSRKALILVGGAVCAGLGGAIIWSTLDKPDRVRPEQPPTTSTGPAEALSNLPKDYLRRGEPPVLGPPLPGDLGRPILRAGNENRAASSPESGAQARSIDNAPAIAALPRREGGVGRQVDPRMSAIFLTNTERRDRQRPLAIADAGAEDPRLTSPERLQAPASPYILQAGTIIPAALVTGLRSDVQGVALAQVTQDVHDSLGGGFLLIPAGARLVGEYASVATLGQQRLAVVWTRLILPSGRSIVLDKLPATDPQGMAGLQDGVDRHWRGVWAAAALSTLLSVGAEAGASGESDLARAVRRGASQATTDVGRQFVGRGLDRAPTLTVRPGAPLRVVLSRDLVLEPYQQDAAR